MQLKAKFDRSLSSFFPRGGKFCAVRTCLISNFYSLANVITRKSAQIFYGIYSCLRREKTLSREFPSNTITVYSILIYITFNKRHI